jgi:hypothetical protein
MADKPYLPGDMDNECINICKAMNALPGIRTTESCCGHGADPFRIWFEADDLGSLPPIAHLTDPCLGGFSGWHLLVESHCDRDPVSFLLEGPAGDYSGAEAFARAIFGLISSRAETSNQPIDESRMVWHRSAYPGSMFPHPSDPGQGPAWVNAEEAEGRLAAKKAEIDELDKLVAGYEKLWNLVDFWKPRHEGSRSEKAQEEAIKAIREGRAALARLRGKRNVPSGN